MAKSNTKLTLDVSQPICVRIDVHKKNWSVCLLHCDQMIGRFTLQSDFEQLKNILQRYSGMRFFQSTKQDFSDSTFTFNWKAGELKTYYSSLKNPTDEWGQGKN